MNAHHKFLEGWNAVRKRSLILMVLVVLLSACGEKSPTPTATLVATTEPVVTTATLDPCSDVALPDEVAKVNDLMREFDDYSKLASSTPQSQLVQVIPSLQEVRRRAESQKVPECLQGLKELQVAHMNVVIETLMAFMSDPKAQGVNQGIAQARDLHMQYDVMVAKMLGLTIATQPAGSDSTVSPDATAQPVALTQSATFSVLNPGPDDVTLLSKPDAAAGGVATLPSGSIATAFGRTSDGLWFQVEVPGQPGQKAWVSSSLVQISGEPPIVSP
jgi:hypothetical protein